MSPLQSPPAAAPFELSGGALALDFANTWGDRGRPSTERLHGYADLLAFARQTGFPTGRAADRLVRRAALDPEGAARAFAAARELRESLARFFRERAACADLPTVDLAQLHRVLPEALSHLRLEPVDDRFAWGWQDPADDLGSPLWPIARSAAELLVSPDLARVRECDAPDCSWLFLDRSRSASRRWCSMESCGNRAKARRHYRRHRA